jgi:hypothetical protein
MAPRKKRWAHLDVPKDFFTLDLLVSLPRRYGLLLVFGDALEDFWHGCSTAESIAMAAKKKRRPIGAYVKAHQRAYAWAEKAVAYRQGGKFAQAKAAAQRARYWLCKAKLIGGRAARGAKRG